MTYCFQKVSQDGRKYVVCVKPKVPGQKPNKNPYEFKKGTKRNGWEVVMVQKGSGKKKMWKKIKK